MRQRRGGGDHSDGGGGGHGGGTLRWLVSYADFITVMMVFFIVLWTTARIDTVKFQQLGQVVHSAFVAGGTLLPLPGPPGAGGPGSGLSDDEGPSDGDPDTVGDLGPGPGPGLGETTPPGVHPWTGLPITPESAGSDVLADFPELAESGELAVTVTERGVVISLQNSVLFDSGSADLRADALPVLASVGEALSRLDNSVLVEGYTDNVPISTAQFPSNWELSTARATNVLRHLLDNNALYPDRFGAVGYGEYRNIYPNDTEENRQRNRRVDIVILYDAPGLNVGQELPARQ